MKARRGLSRASWAARLAALGLAPDLADRLARYLELLGQWGGAVDLFGGADPKRLLAGLVRDALAALPYLGETDVLIDIGSGNGFPAVPLLLARPGARGVLLEPRERRWAFLKEAVRELGLAAEVRRERAADHAGGGYDVATVRGLAAEAWLPQAPRLVTAGGCVLWWTSAANAATLAAEVPEGRVLPLPLSDPAHGVLAVWRRCST
ncbi:MAG: class I SAM-dependent methyltransferase [Thermoanaerobaculaceae bacterium]|nr:class I SAM-dependent methyltransferase [Thermoanaerobaculaceae bacterium]